MLAGLYIHVPFCGTVCPYCDFAVQTGGPAARQAYVDGVQAEISMIAATGFAAGVKFDTIYLGGGTPSALAPSQLGSIIDQARELLPIEADAWVTLEANPEDVDGERAQAWRDLGARTISLGLQSVDDARLAYLGRAHRAADAIAAARTARVAGFDIVSLDLIFGTSGQSPAGWCDEIRAAAALGPDHISCYQLTYHEGTPFWKWLKSGRRTEMPANAQGELYQLLVDELDGFGYEAYEVSNFARGASARSRHNSKYWAHVPYLGVGPSAHSFDGARRRWWNHGGLPEYLNTVAGGNRPIAGEETLEPVDLVTEAVMFGMRTSAGLDLARIHDRWGIDLAAANAERFARWIDDGLLVGNSTLRPTARGMAIADYLAAEVCVG
jgi:oxygen-independent coproporphyrinogen-3 oxidase